MATSGTVVYRTTRDEIIKGALRLLVSYDFENAAGPTANQLTFGAEALNLLVKQWGTRGPQLWERRYAVIFPQYQQSVFALGSPGPAGDHACITTPTGVGGFVSTTTSAAALSGASTIDVTSITSNSTAGISAVTITTGYNIGIELDDGTIQWTTVNGAPSGTTVTLTDVLDDSVTSGNTVYCYQTKLIRPLRISDGWIRQTGGNDVPMNVIAREQYNRFGQKTQTFSTPTQLYYDNQTNTGYVYLYPGFSSVDQLLYIEIQKPIDDFSSGSNDYDLPQEWGAVLKYKLAVALAPEYEVPTEKFKQIKFLADEAFQAVSDSDQEMASIFMQPN